MRVGYVVFFLALSIPFIAAAQTNIYKPIPSENAMWNEIGWGSQCSTCCARFQYLTSGDTIINNMTYHRILKTGIQYYETDGACTYSDATISGYFDEEVGMIRNDSLNRRVYFRPKGSGIDTLLYDFSLQVGDTLPPSYTNINFGQNYVSNIDSILIGNQYHKRFKILSYVDIIEGIGSTFGLLAALFPPFEEGSYLDCFVEDGMTMYPDTIYQCWVLPGINKNVIPSTVELRPNPSNGLVYVNTSRLNESIEEIVVLNTVGQIVYSQQQPEISSGSTELNLASLQGGVYFITIKTAESSVTKKISLLR